MFRKHGGGQRVRRVLNNELFTYSTPLEVVNNLTILVLCLIIQAYRDFKNKKLLWVKSYKSIELFTILFKEICPEA